MQAPEVTDVLTEVIEDAQIVHFGDLLQSPPCGNCQHWDPTIQRDHTGGLRGYKMCHATAMKPDFTCFVEKTKP